MRTAALLILQVATPAFAQSRVYTNADLGKPLVAERPTVTAEQLQSLAAHQYVAPPSPDRSDGPRISIMRSSTTDGPFGEFAPLPAPRRLDGSLWTDPPWEMRAYVGRGYGHGFWPTATVGSSAHHRGR